MTSLDTLPSPTHARAAEPEPAISTEIGPARRERTGGTIRSRVARILALPAVVVLVLLALLAAEQVQQQRAAQSISRSVRVALSVQNLVHELQNERGISAAVLGGNASFRDELAPARRLVDQQQAAVQRLVSTGSGPQARVRTALNDLKTLGDQRSAVDSGNPDRAATFAYFSTAISALSDVDLDLDITSDRRLQSGVSSLQALQALAEATSQERAFLNGVFSASGFKPGEFVQFAGMQARRQAALDQFARFATADQKKAQAFVFGTGAARLSAQFEQFATDAADGHPIVVNPQSWWSGQTTVLDDLSQLQRHVGSQIQLRAHDLQIASAIRIGGLLAVVLLCFLGSIYLTVLATRSITRPLAALAQEADDVAANRLPSAVRQLQAENAFDQEPEPPAPVTVPKRATNEIRAAASALDRLQTVAYGLALDQAQQRLDTVESMANLGRRNQNLIRRQLGFITSLEREEIDPGALSNLFELDHLATRMRRNAASLLVLVGASSPRQWSTPVSVADVIRAAISEVEEYRRVVLRRVDDTAVSGIAVGSIAHLLAELIENGLAFSPPDTEIEIQGRRMADGYLIAVTDQGIGMSTADLARANSRLRGEGDFIANPTRFLGHFVVGKLAREASVDVELLPSPVTGITARIMLPPTLLSEPPATRSAPALTDTGSQPRHSSSSVTVTAQPLGYPARNQIGSQREAPSSAPAAVVSSDSPAQLPSRWNVPAGPARRAVARNPLDADTTPSSGIPILDRAERIATERSATERSATERTITERTITERIATERTMTHLPAGPPLHDRPDGVFQPDPVPVTASRASAPAGEPGDGTVTRNGLRKRAPRTVGDPATPPTGSNGRIIDLRDSERRPAVDPSPASVSARMTALRTGLQRGQREPNGTTDSGKGSE